MHQELIFDPGSGELLARRDVMADSEAGRAPRYAPPGAVVGWTCYLSRQLVDTLPPDIPPIP